TGVRAAGGGAGAGGAGGAGRAAERGRRAGADRAGGSAGRGASAVGGGGRGVELRDLGTTGVRVSAMGLGLVKLGRTAGLKHPGVIALPDDAAAAALLETAREVGINYLD